MSGKGVVVSILDDGLRFIYVSDFIIVVILVSLLVGIEHDHPDLKDNYVSLYFIYTSTKTCLYKTEVQ